MRCLPAILILFAACTTPADKQSAAQAHPAVPPAEATNKLAPLPYTPEQIRQAHPSGSIVRFVQQGPDSPGLRITMHFEAADAEGVHVTSTVTDADGTEIAPSASQRSTWRELCDHAAFPAASTERTRTSCSVPAGTFDCWLYTVTSPTGEINRFWFALEKPGPPVRTETETDGRVKSSMSLVAYRRGS